MSAHGVLYKNIHHLLESTTPSIAGTCRFIWEGGEIETREEIYGGRGGYL